MGPAHLSRLNVLSYTSCVWPLVRHATVVTIVTTDRMAHVIIWHHLASFFLWENWEKLLT